MADRMRVHRRVPKARWAGFHGGPRLAEFLALFPLILPAAAVLERARALHLDQKWSFWDATLVSACIEAGVARLYSEDLPGRKIESLEIVNPFA